MIQLFVAEMKEEKDEDEEGEEREDEKEGEGCDGCVFGLCERFSAKERVAWGLRVIVGIEEGVGGWLGRGRKDNARSCID